MSTTFAPPKIDTLAELVERLGQVPLDRIRFRPCPGTATEKDVIRVEQKEDRICELIDGVLVEKAMGFRESLLAVAICRYLHEFVAPRNLGLVSGSDGMMRLFEGLVRIPDVAFIGWGRLPEGRVPDEPIPDLAPDLAVEVLSRANTPGEMRRKRREYFEAGVRLVWMVDPVRRVVSVYTSPEDFHEHGENDTLVAEPVLSGFSLSLRELFAELDRQAH